MKKKWFLLIKNIQYRVVKNYYSTDYYSIIFQLHYAFIWKNTDSKSESAKNKIYMNKIEQKRKLKMQSKRKKFKYSKILAWNEFLTEHSYECGIVIYWNQSKSLNDLNLSIISPWPTIFWIYRNVKYKNELQTSLIN